MTTPQRITVTTGTATEAQGRLARDVLRSQRQRYAALLRGFDDDAWTSRSRCTEWSVHEVVRHLCDVTLKSTALLRGARPEDVGTEAVDPRTTPVAWLARSAGERPRDTLDVFETASAALLDEADRHIHNGDNADVAWLYGLMPWSIAVLHVFWDAWIHERDILVSLRLPHESPALESRAAASYGLTMACVPHVLTGTPVDETVVIAGDGGGVFRLDARTGAGAGRQFISAGFLAAGEITIAVDERDKDGDVEPLQGELVDVVDSLAGRGAELTEVLQGPHDRVQRLGALRAFFRLPAAR